MDQGQMVAAVVKNCTQEDEDMTVWTRLFNAPWCESQRWLFYCLVYGEFR